MMMSYPNMIRSPAAVLVAGRITGVALTETVLERTESHRTAGGTAYVSIGEQTVLAMARAIDAVCAAGNVPLLLAGLPISIKDPFDVTGQVATAGSRTLTNQPRVTVSAAVMARPRAAGIVLLDRINMSEFVFSGPRLNPHYGTPCTSAGSTHVASDSTSGGVVIAVGGMAVAALDMDTGGSIHIPSAFCNLIGSKPTACRVSMTSGVPLSTSLNFGGPLANSVDCCAIVDAVLSDELGNDVFGTAAAPLVGLRFGATQDYAGADLDSTVAVAFNRAVEQLKRAGAHIVRLEFPELPQLSEINSGGGSSAAEFWAWYRSLFMCAEAQYDPRVAACIRRGDQVSMAVYIGMINTRTRMIATAHKRLGSFSVWLMPAVVIMPSEVAPFKTDGVAFLRVNTLVLCNPNVTNSLDGCALTLPVYAAGKLLAGLSLCGLTNDDVHILRVNRTVEAALWR